MRFKFNLVICLEIWVWNRYLLFVTLNSPFGLFTFSFLIEVANQNDTFSRCKFSCMYKLFSRRKAFQYAIPSFWNLWQNWIFLISYQPSLSCVKFTEEKKIWSQTSLQTHVLMYCLYCIAWCRIYWPAQSRSRSLEGVYHTPVVSSGLTGSRGMRMRGSLITLQRASRDFSTGLRYAVCLYLQLYPGWYVCEKCLWISFRFWLTWSFIIILRQHFGFMDRSRWFDCIKGYAIVYRHRNWTCKTSNQQEMWR